MDAIAQIRRFNRTVTQQIGALEERFLGRDRSLGASRLLFEIGPNGTEVRQLRARLNLDSGYTSRLLRGLEAEGLVRTARSSSDARVRCLKLTTAGRKELALLNRRAPPAPPSLFCRPSPPPPPPLLSPPGGRGRVVPPRAPRPPPGDPPRRP